VAAPPIRISPSGSQNPMHFGRQMSADAQRQPPGADRLPLRPGWAAEVIGGYQTRTGLGNMLLALHLNQRLQTSNTPGSIRPKRSPPARQAGGDHPQCHCSMQLISHGPWPAGKLSSASPAKTQPAGAHQSRCRRAGYTLHPSPPAPSRQYPHAPKDNW